MKRSTFIAAALAAVLLPCAAGAVPGAGPNRRGTTSLLVTSFKARS